eukprot:795525-Lingulodinium_polyedra.AAC.1
MVRGDIEKVVHHVKKTEEKANVEVATLKKEIDLLEKAPSHGAGVPGHGAVAGLKEEVDQLREENKELRDDLLGLQEDVNVMSQRADIEPIRFQAKEAVEKNRLPGAGHLSVPRHVGGRLGADQEGK